MVATLGLAGLRISELVDPRTGQVDLTRGRFKLSDAKTEAGVREDEITLYLRDELLEYVMDRRARGLPLTPSEYFFGTSTGTAEIPTDSATGSSPGRSSARAPTEPRRVRRACRRLPRPRSGARGRRSSRWSAAPRKRIAAQIGHVSPAFTFSVYQQVAIRRYIDEQAVWMLMRFADEPADRMPSRQISHRAGVRGGPFPLESGEFDRAVERLRDDADEASQD